MSQFDTIKRTLKAQLPQDVDLNEFVQTEMTLAVLEHCAPSGDARQAYLLLHNYAIIGRIPFLKESAFLQKAHICLRQCSSKQNWLQLVQNYQENTEIPKHLRLYHLTEEVSDGKSQLRLTRNDQVTVAPERAEVYLDHIGQYHEESKRNYATAGTYRFWLGNQNRPWAEVKLPSYTPKLPGTPAPRPVRPPITVTVEALLRSAKEMQQINPNDYCYDALQRNTIKTVSSNQVIPAAQMNIRETVNLVGMVGAGKSTLMKVLSYHLAKQDRKVVLVLDTVADTFHMYAYFRCLHLKVTPLIGRSEREKYIYQVAQQGTKFLDAVYSEHLTAPCLLAGMSNTGDSAPRFGKEPCRDLKQNEKKYTCPFLDICPAMKMYRDIYSANIIVTTTQGFAAVRTPGDNRLFLEYVLEQADLVMFDECDKVQKTLDEFFTPSTEFAEFMKTSAADCARDMRMETEAIDRMGANAIRYSELRLRSFAMSQRVRETIGAASGTWKTLLSKTFSAMTLYRRLCDDSESGKFPLSAKALEMLESAMSEPTDDELADILDYAMRRDAEARFTERLRKWLEKNGCQDSPELLQHIKLYLIVTGFDRYVHSLDEAYSFLTEEQKAEMELFDFLQARFTAQQKRLPSAVMGNLFGMKNDRKKGLQLYRQYAFGRAMMNRLPWLRLTEEGEPAGPHVLLLSGSSWAEGCLEYHVNVPVQYLLEAEDWKRAKLAETEMVDLNTCIRVSGGGQEERAQHLQQVIQKSIDAIEAELKSESKILMIVNSYSEAKTAADYLNTQFSEKPAACMVRTTDQDGMKPEHRILRGEVGSFAQHTARILVAPALAIERGYNIVNENGHSAFESVFFLVRPMAIPDEISSKCAKLNGIIEQRFCAESFSDSFIKSGEIRKYAAEQWSNMEKQSGKPLTYLNDTMKKDITSGLFILILQIFGRLARITEPDKPAPRVYFADGAFRTSPNSPDGYDCLNALRSYLEEMMQNESSGEIAGTLYAPFWQAFEKGVNNNVYRDLSDGDDTEDEYDY